jgi:Domain of unknown function (DUF4157)
MSARLRVKAPPVADRAEPVRPSPRGRRRPRPAAERSPRALVEAALSAPGEPLDPATRASMEERLGHGFEHVRVHTGPAAAAAARALAADAFARGRHIVFGAGRYRPESVPGRRLLAHELVHTLQQGSVAVTGAQAFRPSVGHPGPLEREADAAADRVAAGERVPRGSITVDATGARGVIARQPAAAPAAPEAEQRGDELPAGPEAVAEIGAELEELLVFDPDDVFGRVRRRLTALAPEARKAVAQRVGGRLSAPAEATLRRVVAELGPPEAVEEQERRSEGAERGPEDELVRELRGEPRREPPRAEAAEPARAEEPSEEEQLAEALGARSPARAREARAAAEAAPPVSPDAAVTAAAEAEPPISPDAAATAAEAAEGDVPDPELPEPPASETAVPEAGAPEGPEAERPPAEPAAAQGAVTEAVGVDAGAVSADETAVEAEEPDEDEEEDQDEAAEPEPVAEPEPGPAPAVAATPVEDEPPPGSEVAETEAPPAAEPVPVGGEETSEDEVGPGDPAAAAPDVAAAADAAEPPADAGELGAETLDDADADAGVGGGGGGGGSPIEEPPAPETPDVSAMEPEQAVGAVASLPPGQLAGALGGVDAASSRSVAQQRQELADSPPELERPTGAPSAEERAAEEREVAAPPGGPARVPRTPEGAAAPPLRPEPLPPPPAPITDRVPQPHVPSGPQGELGEDGARALRESVRRLPTTDPGLALQTGPAPRVALAGNADPQRAREQRAQLDESKTRAEAEARRDAAQPMGETELYPDVPPETLRADIGGGAPAAAAAPPAVPGPGASDEEAAVSIVAQRERGDELRAAAVDAQAGMVEQRQTQQTSAADARSTAQQDVSRQVRENAEQQRSERRGARGDVQGQRDAWTGEQRAISDRARREADTAGGQAAERIDTERARGETQAEQHVSEGNRQAETHRREGEAEAQRERERGEQESSGVLGWLASRATSFFNAIKEGIQRAFAAARRLVRQAIERAQQLAAEAIERARSAIVNAIRWVGDALVAIGDVMLAAFPQARDRFRRAIRERVAAAEARVNQLANALRDGVQRALNLLGQALDAALGLLERGLLAVVDAYRAAVTGAINFARSAIAAFAAFAALVRDVAADPLRWLANLGAAIVDGIRNHLWAALKRAVKEWFNSKLEEVLGLGRTIWQLLTSGGVTLAQIGRMVWAGLKTIIPMALIQLLVEKLVAMIVPAAGAIMAIIEGLQAAWGTVSRILAAFERFFAFLRAVKTGRAGPQFAEAVAAAAVAVIDFVANWLLLRLMRPARAIGARIRRIAQRIGARLARMGRALRGRLRRFGGAIRRMRRRRRARAGRQRQRPDQRLQRAVDAIRPRLDRLLAGGMSGLRLRAQLLWWRVRYRLSALTLAPDGSIEARINPRLRLPSGTRISDRELGRILRPILARAEREYENWLLSQPGVRERVGEGVRRAEANQSLADMGLARDEQQLVMRRARLPADARIDVEPGVQITSVYGGGPAGIRVEHAGAYGPRPGETGETVPQILARRAAGADVEAEDLGRAIAQGQMPQPAPRPRPRRRALQALTGFVRRLGFLTQALEPARRRGAATATAVAYALQARGEVSLLALLSPRSILGMMTARGASMRLMPRTEAGVREREESRRRETRRAGARARRRRLGATFRRLITATRRADIYAGRNQDYALRNLANAITQLVEARLRGNDPNDENLADALVREVVALLRAWHGRSAS